VTVDSIRNEQWLLAGSRPLIAFWNAIAGVNAAPRRDLSSSLISPRSPARSRVASKQLEVGPRRASFDDAVLLVWLAGVLALAGLDDVDLAPRRRQSSKPASDSEQDLLGGVEVFVLAPVALANERNVLAGAEDAEQYGPEYQARRQSGSDVHEW